MLQFVEHFDVDETSLTIELLNKVSKAVVYIILRGKFQQWFPNLLAQSNDLAAQLVVGHLNLRCEV